MTEPSARSLRAQLVNVRETRNISFDDVELRANSDGKTLHFRGYASVTDRAYEMEDMFGPYTETIHRGSFNKTLAEGADVGLLVNHEGIPLARTKSGTLSLAEDGKGLLSDAPELDAVSPLVQTVRSAMDRGDLDEMSMAFRIPTGRQDWSDDFTERHIREVNLHKGDVSIVNYGANPFTSGAALRSLHSRQAVDSLRSLGLDRVFAAFHELRAGAILSAATMDTLTQILNLVDDADTAVDNALIQLSDLMGVVNPDIAQDAALDRGAPDPDGDDDEPMGQGMQMNSADLWLMELKNTLATQAR